MLNKHRLFQYLLVLSILASAYVVRKGDTLWDLSSSFLQNPFSWPQLWERNPHIQNPHLIYPGDSLNIDGTANITPSDTTSQPSETPEGFLTQADPIIPDSLLPKGIVFSQDAYADLRESDFLAKLGKRGEKLDSLTLNLSDSTRYLYSKKPLPRILNRHLQILAPFLNDSLFKNKPGFFTIEPGEKVPGLRVHFGNEVIVNAGINSTSFKPGDFLEIIKQEKVTYQDSAKGPIHEIVLTRLVGYLKVVSSGYMKTRTEVERIYDAFKYGDVIVRKAEPRHFLKVLSYSEVPSVDRKEMARIMFIVDPVMYTQNFQFIMINKGTKSGYKKGDALAIWENETIDKKLPPRLLGQGLIVFADTKASTVMINHLTSPSRSIKNWQLVSVTHRAELVDD
jgi:hypothetical protein